MKKLILLVVPLIIILVLIGYNRHSIQGNGLLEDRNVKKVEVSSLPEGYNYSFTGKKAEDIVKYLSNLNLITFS